MIALHCRRSNVSSGEEVTVKTGDKDELVPIRNSEVLAAALDGAGVTYDFVTIEGAPHGFRAPQDRAEAQKVMVGWFKEHLAE